MTIEGTKRASLAPNTKVYLASSAYNDIHWEWLEEATKALEDNPTVSAIHVPWDHQFHGVSMHHDPTGEFGGEAWSRKTFFNDINAMGTSDVIVALISKEQKDEGVYFELGWAFKDDTPIIAVMLSEEGTIDEEAEINLMVAQSVTYFTKDISDLKDYNFNNLESNLLSDIGENFKTV